MKKIWGVLVALSMASGVAYAFDNPPANKVVDPINGVPGKSSIEEGAKWSGVPSAKESELNSKIMGIAKQFLGVENLMGDNTDPDRNVVNPMIQKFAHSIFHADVPSEEFWGGWCDWFVTFVLEEAGVDPKGLTQTMLGELQLTKAHQVTAPVPGDVVLLQGHIAFYAGEDPSKDYIWILGGNQEYLNQDAGYNEDSSASSYYGGTGPYGSGNAKKHPYRDPRAIESHTSDSTTSNVTPPNNGHGIDIHVDIPAPAAPPKDHKRGFGVNYAKVPRSAIEIIYRMNPEG